MASLPAMNSVAEGATVVVPSVEAEVKLAVPTKVNGLLHPSPDITSQTHAVADMRVSPVPPSTSPSRPKSQNQHSMPVASNYHFPVNGYPTHITPTAPYVHPRPNIRPNGLNTAQLQTMKSPFASMTLPHDMAAQVNAQHHLQTPTSYIAATANGANYAAQYNAARLYQQQQHAQQHTQQQRVTPTLNVMDANGVDMSMAAMLSPPPLANNSPTRVSSSNGIRPMPMKPGMPSPNSLAMSPQGRASPANQHLGRLVPHGHSSSPHLVSPSLAAAQAQTSPSRTPQNTLPSPSLQARQAVGGTGAVGY
ncbi:hypothetical protein EUX98_g3974 [Antrodiella citrinella]|uniref:Uncharacterized protein n=1 Tax=Antrodiella citrinella TaxID=2447956 RepID=A0A4S4MX92_9APHY|nr:hypothetical protein EUX98_g3974 [Antrodiella citrinella]